MPFKLLVVEDNNDTRVLLHRYFTNAGYLVTTANDGQEGVYMAIAEQPDLIIADIAMPEMDGKEMIRQLRSIPEAAQIPIIIFTAVSNISEEQALAIGADKVFFKPFDFDSLRHEVQVMLKQDTGK
jgi:DNA-binding response OmpR family regulator